MNFSTLYCDNNFIKITILKDNNLIQTLTIVESKEKEEIFKILNSQILKAFECNDGLNVNAPLCLFWKDSNFNLQRNEQKFIGIL